MGKNSPMGLSEIKCKFLCLYPRGIERDQRTRGALTYLLLLTLVSRASATCSLGWSRGVGLGAGTVRVNVSQFISY